MFSSPDSRNLVVEHIAHKEASPFRELDENFGDVVALYKKTPHLTPFSYGVLRNKIVTEGGVTEEVFKDYLISKGITWGDMRPVIEIQRERRRAELYKKYGPQRQ